MSDEILINVTLTESRVAIVENGLLQELYLERDDDVSYVGNIYMGRVERVLPGMQAAFVNIGLDRTAFLHANDIVPRQPELTDAGEVIQAPAITELIQQGQHLLVQVIKGPAGQQGGPADDSAQHSIALPGAAARGQQYRRVGENRVRR